MRTFAINELAAQQRHWAWANREKAKAALVSAAHRVKAIYVQRINEVKAVDTGRMKSSFKVERTEDGAILANEAPHFSVMDKGRRPNRPGPPLDAIYEWVLRKRLVKGKGGKGRTRASVQKSAAHTAEAMRIAKRIRYSIQRKGIRGRDITTAPSVRKAVVDAIRQALAEARARSGS